MEENTCSELSCVSFLELDSIQNVCSQPTVCFLFEFGFKTKKITYIGTPKNLIFECRSTKDTTQNNKMIICIPIITDRVHLVLMLV